MSAKPLPDQGSKVAHEHVYTALFWHFGPYGNQKVHVHSCFEEGCDHVLIGDGRKCSGKATDHHRDTLRPDD